MPKHIIVNNDGSFIVPFLLRDGGLRLQDGKVDHTKQVFSFRSPGRRPLHFSIGTIRELIDEGKPPYDVLDIRPVGLEINTVVHIIENNGIEEPGVNRAFNFLTTPGYIANFGDTQTIIDGNHRFVARARAGYRTMDFIWLTREQWRLSLLDVPEGLIPLPLSPRK